MVFLGNNGHHSIIFKAAPKMQYLISVHFEGKPFNITVIQVYAPTTNAKESEVDQIYEELEDLLE